MSAIAASTTSPRLCGGMLVAMPTAMPPEPLTRRLGTAPAGPPAPARCRRSWREIDGFLVDVGEQLVGDLGQAHFGVAHRRRRIAVDRAEVALPVDQHRDAVCGASPACRTGVRQQERVDLDDSRCHSESPGGGCLSSPRHHERDRSSEHRRIGQGGEFRLAGRPLQSRAWRFFN